jgi:hypothetical protein
MKSFRAVCSCITAIVFLSLLPCGVLADPMMQIATAETTDASGYAQFVKELTALQVEAGAKLTASVWAPIAAGKAIDEVYYVAEYANAKDWLQSQAIMAENAKIDALRQSMNAKRTLTEGVVYAQIRDQGDYPDAKVINTNVRPTDAAAYAKALDVLDALMDKNGFEDIKLNVWAVSAGGERAGTQLVSLAAPDRERLAAFIDASGQPWLANWLADAGPLRTLLSNGVYEQVPAD